MIWSFYFYFYFIELLCHFLFRAYERSGSRVTFEKRPNIIELIPLAVMWCMWKKRKKSYDLRRKISSLRTMVDRMKFGISQWG